MAMQNKLRDKMAQSFLDALDEGRIPWKACLQSCQPENAVTGKMYRGINSAMLSFYAEELGFADPRWCTYIQAQKKGWQVRRNSEGCPVEYWAYYDSFQKKLLPWPEATNLLKDPEYANKYLQLRSRVSIVFNAEQIDGIPERSNVLQTNIDEIRSKRDTLLRNMELDYREEGGKAYYSPVRDQVTLPPEESFFDTYSYTCTFLHECGHATGHPKRLNRDLSGRADINSYAREELRAEIASAFTAQAIGLRLTDEQLQPHMDLHKAYIQSWAAVLKDAPSELFRAIKDAEKISDYLIEKGEFEIALDVQQEKAAEDTLASPAPKTTVQNIERMFSSYLVSTYHHIENGFDDKRDYLTLEEAERAALGYVNGTMESDGFCYEGAAVYDQNNRRYLRIYGDYPNEKAHAQVNALIQETAKNKASQKAVNTRQSFDDVFGSIRKELDSTPVKAPVITPSIDRER